MLSRGAGLAWLVLMLGACSTAYQKSSDDNARSLTVGTVQREIRVGMAGDDVIRVLGSPNVVTTDELRREVWVYDKISTDTAYTKIEGGVSLMRFQASAAGGNSSTTQKTLTVVVKYDEAAKVRDFSYHYSKF